MTERGRVRAVRVIRDHFADETFTATEGYWLDIVVNAGSAWIEIWKEGQNSPVILAILAPGAWDSILPTYWGYEHERISG